MEKAEALATSTEWRSTNDILVNLQKQGKEIGAVPHKYSDALWKRFVGACDKFFEAKKKANSEAHGEEKANMEQKQGIISALKELAAKEGEDIMQQVKELQQKWNEIGHVPFREKDRLYKEYREVCDKIYGAFSATQRQRRMNNFRTNLAQKIEKGASTIDTERQRMMRAYERMQEELKTYENNLEIINCLEELNMFGYPLLLGCSRKSVIGLTLDLPVTERVEGTLVTTMFGVQKGCMIVRVHDVKENDRTIKMCEAILNSSN